MGKYEPLANYLKSRVEDSWSATFAQIEQKLGSRLPESARKYRSWWSNQRGGNHIQTAGWQDAGWETRDVDMQRGHVRFERAGGEHRHARASGLASRPDLWRQAGELSGIKDRDQLMEAALLALIQREAGRALMKVGGTMPDLVVPERERPFA